MSTITEAMMEAAHHIPWRTVGRDPACCWVDLFWSWARQPECPWIPLGMGDDPEDSRRNMEEAIAHNFPGTSGWEYTSLHFANTPEGALERNNCVKHSPGEPVARLYLGEPIQCCCARRNPSNSREFTEQILAHRHVSNLQVYIECGGGEFGGANLIYQALRAHSAAGGRVQTGVAEMAGSAAFWLFLAGDKRYMQSGAKLGIHTVQVPNCSDEEKELRRRQDEYFAGLIADRVSQPVELVMQWLCENGPDGTFFTAEEAVKLGLAHQILETEKLIPSHSPERERLV